MQASDRRPSDTALFFQSWLDNPLRAGAFRPSSAGLARAMVWWNLWPARVWTYRLADRRPATARR